MDPPPGVASGSCTRWSPLGAVPSSSVDCCRASWPAARAVPQEIDPTPRRIKMTRLTLDSPALRLTAYPPAVFRHCTPAAFSDLQLKKTSENSRDGRAAQRARTTVRAVAYSRSSAGPGPAKARAVGRSGPFLIFSVALIWGPGVGYPAKGLRCWKVRTVSDIRRRVNFGPIPGLSPGLGAEALLRKRPEIRRASRDIRRSTVSCKRRVTWNRFILSTSHRSWR